MELYHCIVLLPGKSHGRRSLVGYSPWGCKQLDKTATSLRQASLSITYSRSSLRLMSIESVMPSSHLILCNQNGVTKNTRQRNVSSVLSELLQGQ